MHEQEMPPDPEHSRNPDHLEAESVKYNVARIVRLTSGAFALFTHHREGALDLIKVGTIEDLAPHIPTAEQCSLPSRRSAVSGQPTPGKAGLDDLLSTLGL